MKMILSGIASLVMAVLFLPVSASGQSNSRIEYNGLPLFMNGSNVAWISFGADIGPGTTNFTRFGQYFDSVKANGGNTMRLWLHTNGATTPAYGGDGMVTGPGTNTISDLRQILDLAWERKVSLLLSLWSFDMTGTSYGADRAAQNRLMLTDSSAREAYLQNCLQPMVDSLRGHPGILAWEVFNEAEGMSNEFGWAGYLRVPMTDIQKFVNRVAGIVHRTDTSAKVTTGTLSFGQLSDVPSLAKALPLAERIANMSAAEKNEIESAFAERYGFSQPVERILAATSVAAGYNYYRDDRLVAVGGDPDGTLDFYEVHYYSWAGTSGSPLHNPFSHWGLSKPLIVGEFYAQPTFGLATEDLYRILIDNGYAGAYTWQWINATQQSRTKLLMKDLYDTYTADIAVEQVPGTIFYLRASSQEVEVGQPCEISWSAAIGSTVTLNGVHVPNQGDTIVTPTMATDYVLVTTGVVNNTQTITVNAIVADAGAPDGVPEAYSLAQNYPNPFNPSTTIAYRLPERAVVRLSIFDVMGREVASLVNEEQPAGSYSRQWDATGASSGVYYYRIQAGNFNEGKKLLLMR
jgi:hypothetical protein